MSLANDEITLTLGADVVRLRPTLRASWRLVRRYDGFDKIAKHILDGNLTVMADIVAECSTSYSSIPDVLRRLDGMPLRAGIESISAPLLTLVIAMTGTGDQKDTANNQSGERIKWPAYFEKLFGIGCGVMGWPPETTWNATPAEIMAAHRERINLLSAIFGGAAPDEDQAGPRNHTNAEIASGLASLRAMARTGQDRGI